MAKDEDKSLLDELASEFGAKKESGFGDYTQEMQRVGYVPDNPYGHATSLLKSEVKDIDKEGFNVMNDPQILLGNVENEKTMRLYQIDLYILTNMCAVAQSDPVFKLPFQTFWQIFKNEIRVTSAMGGTERQYQAFHIPQQSKKKGFSLFGGKSKARKRQAIDYIIPEEEEESMY